MRFDAICNYNSFMDTDKMLEKTTHLIYFHKSFDKFSKILTVLLGPSPVFEFSNLVRRRGEMNEL